MQLVWVLVELRLRQLHQHFLQQRLHVIQHVLELLHLLLLRVNVLLNLDLPLFFVRSPAQNLLFFLIFLFKGLIFEPECLIVVNEGINFLVENIDISEQVVVLFLTLNKSVLDLLDVSQASGLLDCVERLVNYLHVALVVVDKFHFFLVVQDQFGQPVLQH